MSTTAEVEELGVVEFRWGIKGGIGEKNKKTQFYRSFSYDDVEYALYDCVYLHKEGAPNPYIGKLIKMWQSEDKGKQIKVQWFFRPSDISYWLEHQKMDAMDNEIFFASGEGEGLTNVNPLEAIAGKCNVICTSLDSRNPQPSEEQLQMADFIFYRTFDVRSCTISDVINDEVGGLEVTCVFNRKESEMASGPDLVSKEKDGRIIVKKGHIGPVINVITYKVEESAVQIDLEQREKSEKGPPRPQDPNGMGARPSKRPKLESSSNFAAENELKTSALNTGVSDGKTRSGYNELVAMAKEKRHAEDSSTLDEKHPKKTKFQQGEHTLVLNKPIKSPTNTDTITHKERLIKSPINTGVSDGKTRSGYNELVAMAKEKRHAEDSSTLDEKHPKKTKFQQGEHTLVLNKPIKSPTNTDTITHKERLKEKEIGNKSSTRLGDDPRETNDGRITKPITSGEGLFVEKPLYKLKDYDIEMETDKGISMENLSKKVQRPVGNNLAKTSGAYADKKIEGRICEVTRKPDAEKGKWFMSLPWEERMQSAHEKGTLVLLQNLDQHYTSGEVMDIVWSAFKETCEAKVVQRTSFSSPHSGQAMVIFKTREIAERVLRKLSDGCLILPNQRPLVGCMAVLPKSTGKQSTFVGHLFIDKLKHQMPKEMKDAVSTSHCSQANTIEYELAMDWCLLQSRFAFSWKTLYKQQRLDLKRLDASFKPN